MAGQLWYLSEELVGLALFDDDLDNGTKDKMVSAMKEKEGEEEPLKCATIDLKFVQATTFQELGCSRRLPHISGSSVETSAELHSCKKLHQHIGRYQ